MYFTDFEERLFGSRAKVKVLRYLIRNADHGQVGFDMAKLLGLSPTQVMSILRDFEDANLVRHLLVGRAKAWEVNKESFAYGQASKILSYENEARNNVWNLLQEHGLADGKKGIVEMSLFGSIPNKSEKPDSDIDLLVVVKGKNDIKTVAGLLDAVGNEARLAFGNRLSPLIFTKKEYEVGMAMKRPPFDSISQYPVYRSVSVKEKEAFIRAAEKSQKERIDVASRRMRKWR